MENSYFLSGRFNWVVSISLGGFLFIFMSVFLPFGVSNYDPHHQYTTDFFLAMGGFMFTSTTVSAVNEFYLKPVFVKRVNASVIVFWTLWLLLLLGVANFFCYNWLGAWHDFRLSSAVEFVMDCSTVFIFPLLAIHFLFRYQNLKSQYEQVLTNIGNKADPTQLIHFEGSGANDKVSITLEDFLYARSRDNYVELVFMTAGTVRKELVRVSMSQLSDQAGSEFLVRCHRSFMVNIYNVNFIKGVSQPILQLKNIPEPIQVSKSYREEVMRKLHSLKNFE